MYRLPDKGTPRMTSTTQLPGTHRETSASVSAQRAVSAGSVLGCQPPGMDPAPGAPAAVLGRRPAGTLILAHRGCPTPDRPENTVAAVAAALAGGADGAEVDVRLTADGTLVCSHDANLFRLSGRDLSIAGSAARVLRSVPLSGGHILARLDEILQAARNYGRRRVVVEVKAVSDSGTALRTAGALRKLLADFPADLDITVSSFDPALLTVVRGATADLAVATALLGSSVTPFGALLRRAVEDGYDEVHPNVVSALRDPALVATAHSLGIGVTCWTVNERLQMADLADRGIDGMITDDLASARATLRGLVMPA
jgi:glycerophosphoryl diester phosphodiesterase